MQDHYLHLNDNSVGQDVTELGSEYTHTHTQIGSFSQNSAMPESTLYSGKYVEKTKDSLTDWSSQHR